MSSTKSQSTSGLTPLTTNSASSRPTTSTTPQTGPTGTNKSPLSSGAKAGIGVGVIVFLVAVAILIWILACRRKRQNGSAEIPRSIRIYRCDESISMNLALRIRLNRSQNSITRAMRELLCKNRWKSWHINVQRDVLAVLVYGSIIIMRISKLVG